MNDKAKKKAGTFQLNKSEAIHSWYSYMEGYSSYLVIDELQKIGINNITSIYDPFGGTGTTPLVAVQNNLDSYYSESNPFMLNVIDAKINCVKKLIDLKLGASIIIEFRNKIKNLKFKNNDYEYNGFEKFYDASSLSVILEIKRMISKVKEDNSRKILMLALSSIQVLCSKMIRRGDLRYATKKEKPEPIDVKNAFIQKLDTIIKDISSDGNTVQKYSTMLSSDAREINVENLIDCVITSPPYLNGTNYIRNTKLELKLNNFLNDEKDMPKLHSKGIVAGINNVSKRNSEFKILEFVKPYIDQLDPIVYDNRITKMVIGYFNDMNDVIEKLSIAMKDNGYFVMDIGDSQFAGIHIPTHDLLEKICNIHGFIKYDETILRERRSKNNMILSQRVLRFKLNKKNKQTLPVINENKQLSIDEFVPPMDSFKSQAIDFISKMPYKQEPYCGRNWGHPWHSLCSYHGKLKPAIAHFLISNFTKINDVILDPLSGVGTIPFEACLQGRIGIGNDLSELAYVVTKAKLEKSNLDDVYNSLDNLEKYIEKNKNTSKIDELIEDNSNFGFNGKLATYFHPDTFREIVTAREYFLKKMPNISDSEAMIFSAFLHVLHGNRPYALSRTSHPLTPYSPKGEFIYKNVIEHIKDKVIASYKKYDFENYIKGKAIYGDCNNISDLDCSVDYIISSPPFADSIRFYMQNWMRLWLCGWNDKEFKNADKIFLDSKQKRDFSIYSSFFEMCNRVLKHSGKIILHLGKTDKIDMAEELLKYASKYFKEIYRGSENVLSIEKHGIKDKGATIEHQFLFLEKK